MESDNVLESYRALQQEQFSTLSELVQFVMSLSLLYQRQSVEALLTIKVHERDTLQTLMENNIYDQEDFQWKRYRINNLYHL